MKNLQCSCDLVIFMMMLMTMMMLVVVVIMFAYGTKGFVSFCFEVLLVNISNISVQIVRLFVALDGI